MQDVPARAPTTVPLIAGRHGGGRREQGVACQCDRGQQNKTAETGAPTVTSACTHETSSEVDGPGTSRAAGTAYHTPARVSSDGCRRSSAGAATRRSRRRGPRGDLERDSEALVERHRAPAEALIEALALGQLHDQERLIAGLLAFSRTTPSSPPSGSCYASFLPRRRPPHSTDTGPQRWRPVSFCGKRRGRRVVQVGPLVHWPWDRRITAMVSETQRVTVKRKDISWPSKNGAFCTRIVSPVRTTPRLGGKSVRPRPSSVRRNA